MITEDRELHEWRRQQAQERAMEKERQAEVDRRVLEYGRPTLTEVDLRRVALELAIDQTRGLGLQTSTVVETARAFLAFLNGEA